MTYLDWIRDLGAAPPFGLGDRLGSLNHLDDAARDRAAAAIRTGRSVGLGRPLVEGRSIRPDGKPSYALEVFYTDQPVGTYAGPGTGTGTDHVELDSHGIGATHIDGLNHISVDGTWYAGHPVGGADVPSVWEQRDGIVARALCVDVPALRGTPWVAVDEPVTGAELQAAVDALGTAVRPGDALVVDQGRDRYEAAGLDMRAPTRPGLGEDAARWLATQPLSLLAWDFLDAKHPDEPPQAVHLLNWALGLVMVDNCDFSGARAAVAAAGGIAALVVAPLPMRGATGANVNPLLVA